MSRFALACMIAGAACTANDDVPEPRVGSVTPTSGVPGAIVEVDGAYFCQQPDNGDEDPTCPSTGDVVFGTTPATPTMWSDGEILVEVPATAPGDISLAVEVKGRHSNSVTFTVQ